MIGSYIFPLVCKIPTVPQLFIYYGLDVIYNTICYYASYRTEIFRAITINNIATSINNW